MGASDPQDRRGAVAAYVAVTAAYWYDNEWGYVCRMADIARMMAADL